MTGADPVYVLARRTLLDALDALGAQRAGIVLVGAQAIYLRVGGAGLDVTPHTTDADLGLRPELLSSEPELAACMRSAGFVHLHASSVGTWVTEHLVDGKPTRIQVDLLVPEAVGGPGRRSARIPPHESRAARKTRGLEGALFDHDPMPIPSLDPMDARRHEIAVAGPAALLVAKLDKIRERIHESPRRTPSVAKDALDVLRILRGSREDDLSQRLHRLLSLGSSLDDTEQATGTVAREAMGFLRSDFAAPASRGCDLMARAGAGSGNVAELRASMVELVRRTLARVEGVS